MGRSLKKVGIVCVNPGVKGCGMEPDRILGGGGRAQRGLET